MRSQDNCAGAVQKNYPRFAALTLGLIISVSILPCAEGIASAENIPVGKKNTIVTLHAASTLLPVVDQDDIQPKHRILADRVLRALPPECRNHLKNFYVTYDKHPKNRGLGGESTIIVTGNVPDSEFMALVIHECGHVTDLGGLRGSDTTQHTTFHDGSTPIYGDDPSIAFYEISWASADTMQPHARDTDFVSGYAKSDPFEDFAESFAFYALQKKEFQRLSLKNPVLKAKYDFMNLIVFSGDTLASSSFKRGNRVPWDVTKLPYVWHAKK